MLVWHFRIGEKGGYRPACAADGVTGSILQTSNSFEVTCPECRATNAFLTRKRPTVKEAHDELCYHYYPLALGQVGAVLDRIANTTRTIAEARADARRVLESIAVMRANLEAELEEAKALEQASRCPECNGRGYILIKHDYGLIGERRPCAACSTTGVVQHG